MSSIKQRNRDWQKYGNKIKNPGCPELKRSALVMPPPTIVSTDSLCYDINRDNERDKKLAQNFAECGWDLLRQLDYNQFYQSSSQLAMTDKRTMSEKLKSTKIGWLSADLEWITSHTMALHDACVVQS